MDMSFTLVVAVVFHRLKGATSKILSPLEVVIVHVPRDKELCPLTLDTLQAKIRTRKQLLCGQCETDKGVSFFKPSGLNEPITLSRREVTKRSRATHTLCFMGKNIQYYNHIIIQY